MEFASGWEQRVSAEDLQSAVTEAFTAALTARYADDGPRLDDDPPETARSMATPDISLLAGDPAFSTAIRRLEFPQRLDVLLREIERRAALRRTGEVTGGAVTVRLGHDGHPASFLVDAEKARGRAGAELTREADTAAAEARRRFDGGDPATAELGPQQMIEVLSA